MLKGVVAPTAARRAAVTAAAAVCLYAVIAAGALLLLPVPDERASFLLGAVSIACATFLVAAASRSVPAAADGTADHTLLLKTAIESLPIGITVSGMDGRILYTNAAEASLHGYTVEELRGSYARALAPTHRWKVRDAGAISSMGVWRRETTNVRKDGEEFPVQLTSLVVRSDAGDPVGIVTVCEDISQHRRMQQEILQAKTEWEDTFNTINDAITVHDLHFNIVRANKAAERLLGPGCGSGKDVKCYGRYHGTDYPPVACPSCGTLRTGVPSVTEFFEPHLGKHLEVKALPRLDRDGGTIGVLHIVRDISARVRSEEERRRLEGELLQAQKMESIGRLAGGIAHDFNNILTGIIGYSDLSLMKLPEDHPVREHLKVVKGSGERAAALTRQLLAFGRKQVLKMEPVDINRIIEEMGMMLRRIIGEDVILQLKTSPVRPVMADRSQIEQIIMNLSVNARDAMPSGGHLTIRTANSDLDGQHGSMHPDMAPGAYVMIEVHDTGVGMTKDVQERIFEPFFTTKDIGKGTGLGLATVYGIVRQHSGGIYVYSEPAKGTNFKVYLPATASEVVEQPEPDADPASPGSGTILVVDDAFMVRSFAAEVLSRLGYTVLTAGGAEEALRIMDRNGAIDLLLTDVIMPEMNGTQLAWCARQQRPDLGVLYMSGYAGEALSDSGTLAQEAAFIEKPLSQKSLAAAVKSALDKRKHG